MTDEATKAYEAQLEAIARAIHDSERARVAGRGQWEDVDNAWRPVFLAAARAAAEAIGLKPGMRIIPEADYRRLLLSADADDTILTCETCGAWLDHEEACRGDDYTGCWKAATCLPKYDHTCRSYRVVEAAALPRQPEKEGA